MYARQVFEIYTPEVLQAVLSQRASAIAPDLSITVSVHDLEPWVVKVIFHHGMHIEFVVASTFQSEERRDFFTNRWIACSPMFFATKVAHRELVGRCHFEVDDLARSSGLSFCGNSASQMMVPDSVFFETGGYAGLRAIDRQIKPWRDRLSRVFWRGASTGMRDVLRVSSWRDIPRFRLSLTAHLLNRPELFDIGVSRVVQIWDEEELAEIAQSGLVRDEVSQDEFMNYRYAIDIDGNSTSWPGLFTKLLMQNTIIKIDSYNGYRQWYYDRLIPWKNFVPLSENMGEFAEVVEYLVNNPDESERIAMAGSTLGESMTYENEIKNAVVTICNSIRN
jgi:hypothetical protein